MLGSPKNQPKPNTGVDHTAIKVISVQLSVPGVNKMFDVDMFIMY